MIEWLRSNLVFKKGTQIEMDSMFFLIMDSVEVPDHDRKGKYLYMLHVAGEVTQVNNEVAK